MKIAMFMLFFVCNMFTVLIMRFAYESNYRYNNGMLIGVHIPVRFGNYVYPAFSASENVSVKDTEWLVC